MARTTRAALTLGPGPPRRGVLLDAEGQLISPGDKHRLHASAQPFALAPARPIPCASTAICFHHGTIEANVTGATTTVITASLDDANTVVTPKVTTLVYANSHGQGATVGVLNAKPGTFPQGALKVILPAQTATAVCAR